MKTEYLARSLLLSGVLLAAGCGGGGGGSDPGTPPVAGGGSEPPVQVEPMDRFTAFVKQMIQVMQDGAEPVDVSAFDPPITSDTREPFATAAQ